MLDLNLKETCEIASNGAKEIYNLAANMGGMGFIENNKALCMLSVLINTHLLLAARESNVERFFFSSSVIQLPVNMASRTVRRSNGVNSQAGLLPNNRTRGRNVITKFAFSPVGVPSGRR